MWGYIIVIVVLLLVIALLIYRQVNVAKKNQLELEKRENDKKQLVECMIQEHSQDMEKIEFSHNLKLHDLGEIHLNELEKRHAIIRRTEENFKSYIDTSDELEIVELFVNMFSNGELKDVTIYGQLGIRDEMSKTNYRLDFLMVSPNGVYVIESKGWSGVTHIKSKFSEDILSDSKFCDFGTAKGSELKVININEISGQKNELRLSNYGNPIQQARNYSVKLRSKLQKGGNIEKICAIKNVVVFSNYENSKVFYDGAILSDSIEIDKFTTITTFDNLRRLLKDSPKEQCDYKLINKIIQSNIEYWYTFVLDEEKYNEEPFKCFIKEKSSKNKVTIKKHGI